MIFYKSKTKFGFHPDVEVYEFPFISPAMMSTDLPQAPTKEMALWLEENSIDKWGYIYEMGDLWGVGFYDAADAMAFKLNWS